MSAQPQNILQIDFQNPTLDRTGDWAKAIGGSQFPLTDYEWTQVLAPNEEYDNHNTLVGATGWAINPHRSGADFPFTHPFLDRSPGPGAPDPPITDWEFHFALDQDQHNPRMDYQFLLAQGNPLAPLEKTGEADDLTEAIKLLKDIGQPAPNALLGVEIDGALVPGGFKSGV